MLLQHGFVLLAGAAILLGLTLVDLISLASFIPASILLLVVVLCANHGLKKDMQSFAVKDRAVLVTGCDSGFGFGLAHQLDIQGLQVFAGCLFKEGTGAKELQEICSTRLHLVQLDVSNGKQIRDAMEYVKKNLPESGLWAIVNNAGLVICGEIELTTMEQFERTIDINLLGTIRITKAFMPLVIKAKGRIINVSSAKGRITELFNGAYASSKYALEGFSDTLRLEMRKWGVRVSIIEPGSFGSATKAVDKVRMEEDFKAMWENMDQEAKDRYGRIYMNHFETIIEATRKRGASCMDPVIDAMCHAILSAKPKIRYLIPGGSGLYDRLKLYVILSWFLPQFVMDFIIHHRSNSRFPPPNALRSH